MATYTKSATGFQGWATWACTFTSNTTNLNVTDSTFSIDALLPTVTGKITWSGLQAGRINADLVPIINGSAIWAGSGWYTCAYYSGSSATTTVSWANNASKSIPLRSTGGVLTTSSYFNSSNKTSRTLSVTYGNNLSSFAGYAETSGNTDFLQGDTVSFNFSQTITLDVPPTFSETFSYTGDFSGVPYAGLTTANVTLSSLTAYYGGDFTGVGQAEFTIGSQTVSLANPVDDDVLSIPLNAVGTFTPTVKITDSRGQVTTHTLDSITVNGYVAPSVSFTADRTLASGMPDDEGTYATVDATFTFTDVVADAVAPSVVVTDENGTQTTPAVTWYTTRASDGTLSGTLSDWSTLSSGDTVYGLIPNLNTQYSYQISIRPRDSEGTGTAITQTLSSAFYTVDFLAGGHGIAFGKPASDVGFECNMPTIFHDTVDVEDTLTATDITASGNVGADNFLLDLSDYQTTGSIDKDIYDAIVALGWDSDVLVN